MRGSAGCLCSFSEESHLLSGSWRSLLSAVSSLGGVRPSTLTRNVRVYPSWLSMPFYRETSKLFPALHPHARQVSPCQGKGQCWQGAPWGPARLSNFHTHTHTNRHAHTHARTQACLNNILQSKGTGCGHSGGRGKTKWWASQYLQDIPVPCVH